MTIEDQNTWDKLQFPIVKNFPRSPFRSVCKMHPLQVLGMEKIIQGEALSFEDLKKYSKINLRKKRNLKKFEKHYQRYVSRKIWEIYISSVIARPLLNSFKTYSQFDIPSVLPMEKLPKIALCYLNINYNQCQ